VTEAPDAGVVVEIEPDPVRVSVIAFVPPVSVIVDDAVVELSTAVDDVGDHASETPPPPLV
jgi:hypothetical protein